MTDNVFTLVSGGPENSTDAEYMRELLNEALEVVNDLRGLLILTIDGEGQLSSSVSFNCKFDLIAALELYKLHVMTGE